MSKARPIVAGRTYLLTRRCFRRQLLLRPSPQTNQIVGYCLAVAAARYGVLIHAVCVLSNHYHVVATDPRGELPEFMRWFNEFVAKCINAQYGRWESVWAPGSYSAVHVVERNDVLAKCVYTLHNPVASLLVRQPEHWPGLRSRPEDMLGRRWTFKRPKGFFSEKGPLPQETTLAFCPPPGVDDVEAFVHDVTAVLTVVNEGTRQAANAGGRRFLGRAAIVAQRHTEFPGTRETRRKLNPRIACRDRWRRIEVLRELDAFYRSYRDAYEAFKAGVRDVIFPAGTYWMSRYVGVRCASAG